MKLSKFEKELKKEYQNTFKEIKVRKSFNFQFKFRYVFYLFFIVLGVFLIGDHINVSLYNFKLDEIKEEKLKSTEINKIETKNDYRKLKTNYTYSQQESILSSILSMEIGCAAKGEAGAFPPANGGGNSFDTNVQTNGIDEADISKCDGKYVYSLTGSKLVVYSLTGEILSYQLNNGKELYVKDNKVITFGSNSCYIYEFNDILVEKINFQFDKYIDSRLVNNHIYLVVQNKVNENNILYGNCYYDDIGNLQYGYSIIDVVLDDYSYSSVQTLSGWNVIVYMSSSNFYLASTGYCNGTITSIFMYDINLNPIGIMRVEGTILNQFSMDEYDGYLRVVSTDSEKEAERLNSISVFDLNSLNRVGYLNEGIGVSRQVIKSVRFDKDICYCVTYENTDPLYEISLSDPTNPVIVSIYKAPGYSNYLHTFVINDKEYILGLGYTDSRVNTKISIYINEDVTTQIGDDYILGQDNYYDQCDYLNDKFNFLMFKNHKSLFIYNDNNYLYLGANVALNEYVIFKIDVENTSSVVSIYKTIKMDNMYDSRSFLVEGKLLVTTLDGLLIFDWE